MTDTHSYDGKWGDNYRKIIANIEPDISFIQAVYEIQSRSSDPRVSEVSRIILAGGNYDHSNRVDFCEMLPIVWSLVKDSPLESLFYEQYMDILNGSCPEGRSTRLYQVLLVAL